MKIICVNILHHCVKQLTAIISRRIYVKKILSILIKDNVSVCVSDPQKSGQQNEHHVSENWYMYNTRMRSL